MVRVEENDESLTIRLEKRHYGTIMVPVTREQVRALLEGKVLVLSEGDFATILVLQEE